MSNANQVHLILVDLLLDEKEQPKSDTCQWMNIHCYELCLQLVGEGRSGTIWATQSKNDPSGECDFFTKNWKKLENTMRNKILSLHDTVPGCT